MLSNAFSKEIIQLFLNLKNAKNQSLLLRFFQGKNLNANEN